MCGVRRNERVRKVVDEMVDAVGIEPTTCRLRAVRSVPSPAATSCYKLLSIVQLSRSLLSTLFYVYHPDYARF